MEELAEAKKQSKKNTKETDTTDKAPEEIMENSTVKKKTKQAAKLKTGFVPPAKQTTGDTNIPTVPSEETMDSEDSISKVIDSQKKFLQSIGQQESGNAVLEDKKNEGDRANIHACDKFPGNNTLEGPESNGLFTKVQKKRKKTKSSGAKESVQTTKAPCLKENNPNLVANEKKDGTASQDGKEGTQLENPSEKKLTFADLLKMPLKGIGGIHYEMFKKDSEMSNEEVIAKRKYQFKLANHINGLKRKSQIEEGEFIPGQGVCSKQAEITDLEFKKELIQKQIKMLQITNEMVNVLEEGSKIDKATLVEPLCKLLELRLPVCLLTKYPHVFELIDVCRELKGYTVVVEKATAVHNWYQSLFCQEVDKPFEDTFKEMVKEFEEARLKANAEYAKEREKIKGKIENFVNSLKDVAHREITSTEQRMDFETRHICDIGKESNSGDNDANKAKECEDLPKVQDCQLEKKLNELMFDNEKENGDQSMAN